MKGFLTVVGILLLLIGLTVVGTLGGWFDTWFGNKVDYIDRKIDDATNYETLKKVEDTCRAMIASYTSDKMTYEQYKDSENSEELAWAAQAKMRANKTASSYNTYILKNSFVWADNVPADIAEQLDYLE